MADVIFLLIEIAFAASLLGFITIVVLIPTKKVIQSGGAGMRMQSPLVPSLIGIGSGAALLMFPLSLLSGSDFVMIAGIASSLILIVAYSVIFFEHRAMKRLMLDVHTPLETAHAIKAHDQTMTVECPRCGKHLTVEHGATTITCPHCGLSGSL